MACLLQELLGLEIWSLLKKKKILKIAAYLFLSCEITTVLYTNGLHYLKTSCFQANELQSKSKTTLSL